MSTKSTALAVCPLLLLITLVSGGCCKDITLLDYPEFYDDGYESITVVPFENQSFSQHGSRVFTRRLVSSLRQNETYGVEVVDLNGEGPPDRRPGMDELRERADTDLLLTGTVNAFGYSLVRRYRSPDFYYGWYYPYRGVGFATRWGPPEYYFTQYGQAYVEVDAVLVRVDSGDVLWSGRSIIGRYSGREDPPLTPEVWANAAADEVVQQIVEGVAIVQVKVNVDPSQAMQIGYKENGRWRKTDDFRADDTVMTVRLRLPREAARNKMRLEVRGRRSGDVVASRDFVWGTTDRTMGYDFDPSQIATEAGTGDYRVVLVGETGEDLLSKDVEIDPARR